ncbi:MAG: SagB/ThcOx family dehydrogenase [Bacteroidota bacterium]|jgi:SagB-type dehydrogenase family enzyme
MKRKSGYWIQILLMTILSLGLNAQDLKPIELPRPDTSGGKPLMEALKLRKSSRSFGAEKLSKQQISNLLWAAFGINRPDGHRTAPSAMNWQEIDIYVAVEDGLFLYDAKAHRLNQILKEDLREKTGTQAYVKDAFMNLVYVADLSKTKRASQDDQSLYTGADCGFVAQNVYLYCASEGLAAVVRGSIDRTVLSKAMNLRADQKIILAQTVGYPKK